MRPRTKQLAVAIGAAVALTVPLVVTAVAVPVPPGTPRGGSLTQVGPTTESGFPAWYRDSSGMRLEACVTLDDPLCSTLPDEVPDPDAPISFPDNFPGEFFYQLAGATVTGTGVDLDLGMDLEGAWANEAVVDGDQMVFGRIRIRDKSIADGRYRITHPYGVDEFTTTGGDGINYTQDIGTTAGAFGQALGSRIGPFLKWDPAVAPAAPAGYTGDPGVDHKVTGSPYGTNFVKVERLAADGTPTLLAQTDVFSVQGRLATNSGVNLDKATYTVGADGKGVVEVYATSEPGASIQIVGDAGLGFPSTRLRASGGAYYARVPLNGPADGRSVTVTNAGDVPAASKTLKLVDVVTVSSATYDATHRTLAITASSSDQDSMPGQLSALGAALTDGKLEIRDLDAPPAQVSVLSSKGGSTTVPVVGSGATIDPDAPVAAAYAPTLARPGQAVTLTGTGSAGVITAYEWKQVDAVVAGPDVDTGTVDETGAPIFGPSEVVVPVTEANRVALAGSASAVATFVAPQVDTTVAFRLLVSGPGGVSESTTVSVAVKAALPTAPVTANAGTDVVARRGVATVLSGVAGSSTDSFAWRQVSGPAGTLTGASTAKPSFALPLMPLPAQPSTPGHPATYTASSAPAVLELTVTAADGRTATDQVAVQAQAETLTIGTAEYRAGTEWRVSGTSSILAGQRVAVVIGSSTGGRVLGFATVDAAGAYSFRGAGTLVPAAADTMVTVVTAQGGTASATFRRR